MYNCKWESIKLRDKFCLILNNRDGGTLDTGVPTQINKH
jgi:hypothetical protein